MPRDLRGGFPTCWRRTGDGARNALLIHCSLAHQGAWKGVCDALGQGYQFTTFDLPGHGQSADWDGRGDYQDVTCAIARDLLDGPADLVGHSFGATVALRLAVEAPEHVRSLVLIEPICLAAVRDLPVYEVSLEEHREFSEFLSAGQFEKAAEVFTGLWGTGRPWSALSAAQKADIASHIGLIAASQSAIYQDPGGILAPGRLEALNIPVLMLSGGLSPPVVAAVQQRLETRLPNARCETISGARHMVAVTHPQETATAIARFHGAVES